MTALFCQCNLLILETKRRTVCASLRKEACLTDIDLLKYQHTLHYIADFCIHLWVLVTCHNKGVLFYLKCLIVPITLVPKYSWLFFPLLKVESDVS